MKNLSPRARWVVLAAPLFLVFLTLLYWKIRIVDLGIDPTPSYFSSDLYDQHYPSSEYAFSTLRAGQIPLWNPYQMCGEPFLATVPYVGLFYPLNFPHLLFDTGVATEVSLVLHMMLGALGMWALLRRFRVSTLGALCGAVTFVWSGWLSFNVNQPSLYNGMTWFPLTALLMEMVAAGRPWARLGLVLAVGCQVLQGGVEVLVHGLYAGAFFGVGRLIDTAWQGEPFPALKRMLAIAACISGGMLLGAIQAVPTAELLTQSARAPGALSFEQISGGAVTFMELLRGSLDLPQFLQQVPIWTLGALPVVAGVLVLGYREQRLLWICALAATVVAVLLASGGPLFRLYYLLPIGSVFRRPIKFLDIYTFGQAVLTGVAISRLESWTILPARRLWLHPAWLAALGLGGAAQWWAMSHLAHPSPYLPALLALLLLFALIPRSPWRRTILVALCALQAASLFFVTGTRDIRPWRQPEFFTRYDDLLETLQTLAGHDRSFIYGNTSGGLPPWIAGKRMRNRLYQPTEYEALVAGRYATFFKYVAAWPWDSPFLGIYNLAPTARWRLMDLTGTRYFVAKRGDITDNFLSSSVFSESGPRFQLVQDGWIRIFEKTGGVMPRAYFVPDVRVVPDPSQVLATLDDEQFDPQRQVILEQQPERSAGPSDDSSLNSQVLATLDDEQFDPQREVILEQQPERSAGPSDDSSINSVEIVQYHPERVAVAVTTDTAGFLVLSDLFYPGWKALIGDKEVPIYRANYLFRAVQVDAGSSLVVFDYDPKSFRIGLLLSIVMAVTLAAIAVDKLWRAARKIAPADAALHS